MYHTITRMRRVRHALLLFLLTYHLVCLQNFFGGMFNAYPVTGSFSRSAVNNESGAQSGISAMVTATMVAITLLLLTSVFEKLPLCVLAAIVISGVLGLFDYTEALYLWKVHKFDFGVWNCEST